MESQLIRKWWKLSTCVGTVYLCFKQDVSLWPAKVSEVWRRSMKHRSLWIAVLIVSTFGDGVCASCSLPTFYCLLTHVYNNCYNMFALYVL